MLHFLLFRITVLVAATAIIVMYSCHEEHSDLERVIFGAAVIAAFLFGW
jgi:hypothetical protein